MALDPEVSPFTPQARVDPYPVYRTMREQDPVHWDSMTQSWLLTAHRDVSEVLRHRAFVQQLEPEGGDAAASRPKLPLRQSMLFLDPPAHTRLRSLVSQAFTPRMVEGMRPQVTAIAG